MRMVNIELLENQVAFFATSVYAQTVQPTAVPAAVILKRRGARNTRLISSDTRLRARLDRI